jgi:pyruvate/2-oxoglutarate dehydrogenase complex dihydrolipoamide acyltransferase (E2) component
VWNVELRLPQRSGDQEYATVQKWLKAVGDRVDAGDPVVEIEMDKATEEVVSPVGGRLAEILAEEGDELKVDAVLAIIDES